MRPATSGRSVTDSSERRLPTAVMVCGHAAEPTSLGEDGDRGVRAVSFAGTLRRADIRLGRLSGLLDPEPVTAAERASKYHHRDRRSCRFVHWCRMQSLEVRGQARRQAAADKGALCAAPLRPANDDPSERHLAALIESFEPLTLPEFPHDQRTPPVARLTPSHRVAAGRRGTRRGSGARRGHHGECAGVSEPDGEARGAVSAGRPARRHRAPDRAEARPTAWGQSVVVENKPGAGGNIGADLWPSRPPTVTPS